jgi:UrcA family protein
MRHVAIVCGLLLAACSTVPAAANPAPQARFTYGDLELRSRAGQLALVARVQAAAEDYCRDHAAVVTPARRLGDPRYCPSVMRAQLMWAMPDRVRAAYDAGWRRRPRGNG